MISDLSFSLAPKVRIQTRHARDTDWISTEVTRHYNAFLEFELTEGYLDRLLMLGDQIICKVKVDEESFMLLEAVVYNIKLESRKVVVNVLQSKLVKNTRNYPRFDVRLYCGVDRPNENRRDIYSVVDNISKSGLSIVTNEELEMDETISIHIYFQNFEMIDATCKVKWKDKSVGSGFRYGLEITEMEEYDVFFLEEFLEKTYHEHNFTE